MSTGWMKLVNRRCGQNAMRRKQERRKRALAFVCRTVKSSVRWFLRRGVFILIAILGILYGVQQSYDKLPEINPLRWKDLKNVEISGNKMLTREDVITAAGLEVGMKMDSVFEDSIVARLLGEPWVSSVKVRKVFPAKIAVEIVEAEALMSAFEAGSWIVYSEKGKILPLSTRSAYSLPVTLAHTREGREVCAEFLYAMKALAPDLYNKVSQVSFESKEGGVEVFFSNVKFKTLFPAGGEWKKETFSEFRRMAQLFPAELNEAAYLDLRFNGFAYIKGLGKRKKNG